LQAPPAWIFQPTLDNYREALFEDGVLSTLINSLIVAISTTVLAVVLGVPAAFALARFEFRGKKDLWFWFITNRMVSPIVLALPFFLIARNLGLLDKHITLVLIYLTFNLPIVIWIVTDQFRGIPYDLDEAARLEGASQFTIMTKICLPLAMPGVAVSSIFAFIFSWNELMFGLILTRSEAKTAPAMAVSFMEGYNLPYSSVDLCSAGVKTACARLDHGSRKVRESHSCRADPKPKYSTQTSSFWCGWHGLVKCRG